MTHSALSQTGSGYALALHGGAGGNPEEWTEEFRQARVRGLNLALEQGRESLAAGASALDVVEQVVRLLEDDERFNAGRGCVLNENGEHELDASIMDGSNLRCGAVAGIKRAKNPITVARRVMEDTRHILLSGDGADRFAEMSQVELATDDYFRTARQIENWQRWKKASATEVSLLQSDSLRSAESQYLGTVGCVARDLRGNLAAATSTGGLIGKRWGRVGDSPIVGAGTYAENETCAVSGTGIGEEFIRHGIAADIAARMRYARLTLAEAVRAAIDKLPRDGGGVIAVDAGGNVTVEFNTRAMSYAFADGHGNKSIGLTR